jgi:hypothetical protein
MPNAMVIYSYIVAYSRRRLAGINRLPDGPDDRGPLTSMPAFEKAASQLCEAAVGLPLTAVELAPFLPVTPARWNAASQPCCTAVSVRPSGGLLPRIPDDSIADRHPRCVVS